MKKITWVMIMASIFGNGICIVGVSRQLPLLVTLGTALTLGWVFTSMCDFVHLAKSSVRMGTVPPRLYVSISLFMSTLFLMRVDSIDAYVLLKAYSSILPAIGLGYIIQYYVGNTK